LGSSSPGVNLPKLIEHKWQLVRRNADPRIFHVKNHLPVFRFMPRRYPNFTVVGELNCIIDEIQ